MIPTKEQLILNIKKNLGIGVLKIREYSNSELEEETGEYFENDKTQERLPNAFKNKNQLKKKIKDSKTRALTKEDLLKLDNSDVGDVLSKRDKLEYAKKLASNYDRDIDSIIDAIMSGTPLPPPIVIKEGDSLYLLSGNTRLMASVALNADLPCKIVDITI